MIDIKEQRAECARLQAIVNDSLWLPGTSWPALITAHLEALDEIQRLREYVERLGTQVIAAGAEMEIILAQKAEISWLSYEIERLREAMRVGCRIMGWAEDGSWAVHARDTRDEIERLRQAGKFLAQGVPPFERRMHDAYERACRVFEEGE